MPKIIFPALLLCLLLTAPPARAEREVAATFVNNTELEIVSIALRAKMNQGMGGLATTMHVVPGNNCTVGFGGASELTEIVLDMGLMRFSFNDLSGLAGRKEVTLAVALDENDEPFLESDGEKTVRVKGEAALQPGNLEEPLELSQILAAKTMAALKDMKGVIPQKTGPPLRMAVTFADIPWLASVQPGQTESRFGDPAQAPPGVVIMYTQVSEEVMEALLQSLHADKFRPWFAQVTAGPDMNTEQTVKFPEAYAEAEEALKALMELFAGRPTDAPGAVEGLLLRDQNYKAALAGSPGKPAPAYRIRCSNSALLELTYYPDAGALVNMTR